MARARQVAGHQAQINTEVGDTVQVMALVEAWRDRFTAPPDSLRGLLLDFRNGLQYLWRTPQAPDYKHLPPHLERPSHQDRRLQCPTAS